MGKLFGTDGIRGVVNAGLDADLAYKVGLAAAQVLTKEGNHRPLVAIGKDTRISSDLLEGALIASFFSLSENLDCFALAAYLCEASAAVVVPNDGEGEILNLLLNALYTLKSNLFTPEFIKAVFELRLAALSGLEPTVGACPGCGRPLAEADERYFFLTEGLILCPACASGQPADETPYRLSRAVYAAIAYVTAAKPKAIFSFRIGDEALHDLSVVAEKYLQNQLERTFPTLEFYKTTRQIPSE